MNILLAIDDSLYSQSAIDSVIKRLWHADTAFHILNVVEPFHPEYAGWHTSYVPLALEAQKERIETAKKMVQSAADKITAGLKNQAVSCEVIEGYVKDEILNKAKSWPADFIIMGSHGRQGLEKFLLGSVSQAVVAHAPCSVEIIKLAKN